MNGEPPINTSSIDTSMIDADEFARSIGSISDDQLREGMSGPLRDQALDEVFDRMERHFRPHAARDTEAVIHFRIGGRADGGHDEFEVVIRDGSCRAGRGLGETESRVTLELDAVDFMRLVTGNASGPALFMTGKLRIKGDMFFAPQILGLFSIPSARPRR